MRTFSVEIFTMGSDGKTGCLINEYDVSPCHLTMTVKDLLSKVNVIDLADGIDIQIRKEK